MPRSPGLAGPSEGGSAPGRARPVRSAGRSKACAFCHDRDLLVDYKDTALLRRFISDRGRIRPRRVSGTCARHQIEVAAAIKTARELALLPSVPPTGRVRIDTEERAAEGAGAPTMEKVDA